MDPEHKPRGSEEAPGRKNLLQELTRRHVVQVALLYFAVAWTFTEVLTFLLGAIPLFPAWSETLVAILFVLGFPVAMFLAWRFDIAPDGIKRTEATTARGKLTVALTLALLIASTAGLFYLIYPQVQERTAQLTEAPFDPPENSIAVMSFLNMGSNPDNEYFSQGVPDTILHKLANLKGLIVVSRTSSFAFSDSNVDATTIGRELNVHYLLEGSVQRVGNELRIITQLISTLDGTHVWSLDRRLVFDNIFSLQDEIAIEVTKALQLTLLDEERERLLAHGTDSVPAYLAYLRGNYASQSRSLARIDEALQHYEEAIGLDAKYARAYVGISRTYENMGRYGAIDRGEGDVLARQYVETALQHDDKLGEAYASLAYLSAKWPLFEPDEELVGKAMALSPNDANVLRIYAQSLCIEDSDISCNEDKAAIQMEAIKRSPEDPNLYFDLAWTMAAVGRLDEVPKYFSEAVRRNPNMTTGYTRLGRWYHGYGNDTVRGVACLREAIARDPQNVFPKGELALIYIDLGLDQLAEQLLGDAAYPHGAWDDFLPFVHLKLHVYRNEHDAAVAIAEKYYEQIAAVSSQTEIVMKVLIDDAGNKGNFSQVVQQLELIIDDHGQLNGYENTRIESNIGLAAAISLIRVYKLTDNAGPADALEAASSAFLQQQIAETPLWRPAFARALARLHLWQGDADEALDELEIIPGTYMRAAWYLNRIADFQGLHGQPRFEAVIDALQLQTSADRTRLETLGDKLPPCVAHMRTIVM